MNRFSHCMIAMMMLTLSSLAAQKGTSSFKHECADGQTIEIVGIGRLTTSNPVCWTPDGVINKDLTLILNQCLDSRSEETIPISPLRKNRVVLIKVKDAKPGLVPVTTMGQAPYFEKSIQASDGSTYYLVFLSADKLTSTWDPTFDLYPRTPKFCEIPFKLGNTGMLGDARYEIASIKSITKEALDSPEMSLVRNIDMQLPLTQVILSCGSSTEARQIRIVSLDKDGYPLVYLSPDPKEPKSKQITLDMLWQREEYVGAVRANTPLRRKVRWTAIRVDAPFLHFVTNAPIQQVAKILLFDNKPTVVTFSEIPLDPHTTGKERQK